MHGAWFRSTFLRTAQLLPLKEWEPILQILWIISSHILYFSFKSCRQESSSSFIRFQCILFDSGVLFSDFSNFYKLRREDLICCGGEDAWIVCIIWCPRLYFNFKTFKDPNSAPFIRFQCIMIDSRVPFYDFLNSYKLKRGDLISGGNHFCR